MIFSEGDRLKLFLNFTAKFGYFMYLLLYRGRFVALLREGVGFYDCRTKEMVFLFGVVLLLYG